MQIKNHVFVVQLVLEMQKTYDVCVVVKLVHMDNHAKSDASSSIWKSDNHKQGSDFVLVFLEKKEIFNVNSFMKEMMTYKKRLISVFLLRVKM